MLKIRDYLIAIVGIVALLVIGIIILIYYGTSAVFYLMMIIIIVGIGGWIYNISRIKSKQKDKLWLRNSKERVATEIKDLYLTTEKNLKRISELNENIDVKEEENQLMYAKANLISLGCYTQSYDIIYKTLEKANLSFLTQRKKEIEDVIKRISNSVVEKLAFKISEIYLNLRNIISEAESAGFNIEKLNVDTKINSMEEGIEKINFLRNKEKEIFDIIYKETLNLEGVASKVQNTEEIKNEILSIKKGDEKKLIGIRKKLNEILGNKVNEVKESIYESQRKLSLISLTENDKKEFENIVKSIENLNLKNIAEIEKIESNYRNFLKNLLELRKQNFTILSDKNIEIPEWLKIKYGGKENENLTEKLNAPIDESLNIVNFADQIIEKIIYAEKRQDNVNIPEKIMKASNVVFKIIDDIIEKKGFVTSNDLSVSYKEDFLRLYKERYPENANKIKIIQDLSLPNQNIEQSVEKRKQKKKRKRQDKINKEKL